MLRKVLPFVVSLGVISCGGSAPPAEAPEAPPAEGAAPAAEATPAPAPQNFAEQVALGQTLYGEKCAGCHGSGGEGTPKGPKVVGLKEGALPLDPPATAQFRKTQFKTVMDIAAFVVKAMPPNEGGSLSDEQYFAILAFDLKANGIDLGDKKLDAALAATLEVPR
jgi:mono/diheme cytochrome c family protein